MNVDQDLALAFSAPDRQALAFGRWCDADKLRVAVWAAGEATLYRDHCITFFLCPQVFHPSVSLIYLLFQG